MKKTVVKTAIMISLATLSIQSNASNLLSLSGMQFFAKQCEQKRGTSYVTNNQGRTWGAFSYQDISHTLNQAKTTARLNASMSGQKVSAAELDKYLGDNQKNEARKMESLGTLQCRL